MVYHSYFNYFSAQALLDLPSWSQGPGANEAQAARIRVSSCHVPQADKISGLACLAWFGNLSHSPLEAGRDQGGGPVQELCPTGRASLREETFKSDVADSGAQTGKTDSQKWLTPKWLQILHFVLVFQSECSKPS